MTSAVWPTTLPQCPILNAFSEQKQANIVAFSPDIGPAKIRKRSSSAVFQTSLSYRMTTAEASIFDSFFQTDLQDGALPFSWLHPVTKIDYLWMFDPKQAPKFDRVTPGTYRISFNLLRIDTATQLPPQVRARGYNTRTFHTTFTTAEIDIANTQAAGFKMYPWNFFGSTVNLSTIHLQDDGSVLMDGDTVGPGGGLSTLTDLGGSPKTFHGTVFGGGGYFECVFKFDPQDIIDLGFAGWPAWWSMTYEHLLALAGEQWTGQVAGYHHFAEVDFFEYLASAFVPSEGTNFYGSNWHDYQGPSPEENIFGQYPTNIVSLPSDPDFTQYHKYGCLWVPATGGNLGYLQFFFDNIPVGRTYSWLESLATDPPPGASIFTYSHSSDDFGYQGQNVRVVLNASLLPASSGDKIQVNFALGSGTNAVIDSAYIGHATGAVTGTGGTAGSSLMSSTSAGSSDFAGTLGAENVPTGWANTGNFNGNTLADPGTTINGHTTYYNQQRDVSGGGFQGIQLSSFSFSFLAGRRYKLTCWLRIPTGVTAASCTVFFGPHSTQIASAATLAAATPDTWISYTTDYNADGTETTFAFVNSSFTTGNGFDFALPDIQLYSIDPYVVTFDGTKKQLTFEAGSTSFAWSGQTSVLSDPVLFSYDDTKDLIIAFHLSGDSVNFGIQTSLSGANTYLSVAQYTSETNIQPDNSSDNADSFDEKLTDTSVGISSIDVCTYTLPGVLDRQHLGLVFGTYPGAPMTVNEISVWQVDASNNITA